MSELSELFARDPLGYTDQDIETIVKRMREAQTQFDLGIKVPVAERKRKSANDLLDKIGPVTDDILKQLGLEK